MPRDTRMSRMLHVLIHMDRHVERATSERIAQMLDTNPVVVRRMMAGFREAGIVTSEKGHGGGWTLARALDQISLLDVYRAIGEPALFNIGPDAEVATCLVERAVDARMGETLSEAEQLLMTRFASIRVSDIAQDFERRFAKMKAAGEIGEAVMHRWTNG
ncbi:Rrf2 family transcriptional regulator [Devosia chinhatensis]|uniref:Rrf2 family transcriptional regulator n=1 Tax=Devosia chinhatensis TaxID=429727 RepID=A0A0F5FHS7_9HYPH|nr:Rrf2 family transcriptional regulator [Devosia chinhatensis]KKB08353.1 Rrf2 family transcriptional regulator [Devosia chinhatensis]